MTTKQIALSIAALVLLVTSFAVGSTLGYKSGYLDGTCQTWDAFLRGLELPQAPGNYPVDCPQAQA